MKCWIDLKKKKNKIPLVSCLTVCHTKLIENHWIVVEQATNILEIMNSVANEIIDEKIGTPATMGLLIRSLENGSVKTSNENDDVWDKFKCQVRQPIFNGQNLKLKKTLCIGGKLEEKYILLYTNT
uniref:Uncharacterized protein n=1 Tax=Anopheles minimus TaxID=112268 RepID=A0A182W7W6_9DIPT